MTEDLDRFDDDANGNVDRMEGVADELVDDVARPNGGKRKRKTKSAAPRIAELVAAGPQRDAKGHFLPGNDISKGHQNRKQARLAQQLIAPHRAALIQRAMDLAFSDESPQAAVAAVRELLQRLMGAPLKADEELSPVEGLAEAQGLQAKAEHVVNAAGRGEIAPAAARALLGSLADAARIATGDELLTRIERLEAALQGRTVEMKS